MTISENVFTIISKAFGVEVSQLTKETNLLKDLNAKSTNYFPIMNELEEEYDLDLEYQEFRSNYQTIGDIIAMVIEEA